MKTDSHLGKEIQQFLVDNGVETPFKEKKKIDKDKISSLYSDILEELGMDLNDDSIADTPNRVSKMYVDEIFSGLNYNNFPKCKLFDVKHDEMICVQNIQVMSVCEHHIQTINGVCHVAYIPNGCIGLSKLNRIVNFFSRRPQVQERLTEQIYFALKYILKTEDVAVMIKADHFCVKARGVGDQNSYTTTTKLGGSFKTDFQTRNEFLNMVNNNIRCW